MSGAELAKRQWVLRILFALLIAYTLLFTISYTLEYRVEAGAVRWLTGVRIALFATACGYLWLTRGSISQLLDPFSLCIVAVILLGAASGLPSVTDWFTYFRQLFQYSFLLALYLIGREVATRPIRSISIKLVSSAILLGYAIATAIYVGTPGLHSGSYSFQPNLALLPIASGLTSGNWVLTFLGSLIVVVGNKRAVYVGLAIMIAVYIAAVVERKRGARLVEKVLIVCVTAPVIGIGLGLAVHMLASSVALSMNISVPTVVDRFTTQPTFNAGADAQHRPKGEAKVDPLVRITSARSVEVQAVWEMLNSPPYRTIIGSGFGSAFTVKYFSPNDYAPVQFDRVQADLAPVQIALTSGVPLALVFTVLLSGMIFSVFVKLGSASQADMTMALFSIGLLLDTMLGFHPTNPLCWMALGIVSRRMLPNLSNAKLFRFQGIRHLRNA